MFMDKQLILCDAQDFTGAGIGAEYSTNVVDLGAGGHVSSDIELLLQVCTSFAGVALTASFSLECDDNEGFASAKTIASTLALGLTDLEAGDNPLKIKLPADCERYIRLCMQFTVDPAAGALDAALIIDRQTNGANIGN